MQSAEKFMADLLAIVASTQESEDQQIAAAKKLSTAYAVRLCVRTLELENHRRPHLVIRTRKTNQRLP
jgi:hypothetical protein